MVSRTKKKDHQFRWHRYQRRCDVLAGDQWKRRIGHPVAVPPGYFVAEGWSRPMAATIVRPALRWYPRIHP